MIVIASLIGFAFWISWDVFLRIQNRFLRFLGRLSFFLFSVAASFPLSLALQPKLPDFRVIGDGGVGMAYNALTVASLYATIPCCIMLMSAFGLSRLKGPMPVVT
mgnify:CR=1 FL=1